MLLIILCSLPASGCWDARDINDRNILTAVVVDKTDYGFAFYVEVPPLTGGANGSDSGQNKPVIVKSEGRTLTETRDDLDRKMDRPIFLGAVQTVILTERLANYGVEEYLLRLRQIFDYRKTVHVVVTPDDPEKLLGATSEHAQSAGFAIYDTIEGLVGGGMLYERSLMDILERLSSPYQHFSIPTFSLIDDEFTFTGLTVFSGGMKTGFIPAADINPMVFVKNKSAKAKYTVEYHNTKASIDVMVTKIKIRPHNDGEQISFDIALEFKAILMYPAENKPITDEDMAIIQATLKAMLEQEFATLFAKSQQVYHHDVFNLFEQFQNTYPEEYKRMNWAEEYEKAALNLSITVKLSSADLIDYNPEG